MACKKHNSVITESKSTDYRGVEINRADHNRINKHLEEQDTHILNNNPRNSDMAVQ